MPAIDKVVGYTYTAKAYHDGFVWTAESGLIDMGTLPPYSSKPDLLESFAQAINKKGDSAHGVSREANAHLFAAENTGLPYGPYSPKYRAER